MKKSIIFILIILTQLNYAKAGEIIDQLCGTATTQSSVFEYYRSQYHYSILPKQKTIVSHFYGVNDQQLPDTSTFVNSVAYNVLDSSYSKFSIQNKNGEPFSYFDMKIFSSNGDYTLLLEKYPLIYESKRFRVIDLNTKKEISESELYINNKFSEFGFIGESNHIICLDKDIKKFYVFDINGGLIDSIKDDFGIRLTINKSNNYFGVSEKGELYKLNFKVKKFEYLMNISKPESIFAMDLSADCSKLAITHWSDYLLVFDLITKKKALYLEGNFWDVAFSPDNRYFVYASWGELHFCDQVTMEEIFKSSTPHSNVKIDFIDNNKLILTNNYMDTYCVSFNEQNTEYRPFFILAPAFSCNLSRDDNIMLFRPGYIDENQLYHLTILNKNLNVIGVNTFRLQVDSLAKKYHEQSSLTTKFYKDKYMFFVTSNEDYNYIYNFNYKDKLYQKSTEKYKNMFTGVTTYDDDNKAIFANKDGNLYIYDLNNTELINTIKPNYNDRIDKPAVFLFSEMYENNIYYLYLYHVVWPAYNDIRIGKLNTITNETEDLGYQFNEFFNKRLFTFSKNNRYLIYCNGGKYNDKTIKFLNLQTLKVDFGLSDFNHTKDSVIYSLNLSPDSKLLAIGLEYKTLIYDIENRIYIDSVVSDVINDEIGYTTIATIANYHTYNMFSDSEDILNVVTHAGDVIRYKFDRVVSVNEDFSKTLSAVASPNPNDGIFSINLNQNEIIKDINIYNYLGEDCSDKLIYNISANNQIEIELVNAIRGFYIAEIITVSNKYYSKVIIK